MALSQEKRNEILVYLKEQIAQSDYRLKAYVFNEAEKRNPTRNIYVKLNGFIKKYLNQTKEARWFVLTGLRGAGKTTLLAQLYCDKYDKDVHKLYLSIDHLVRIIGVSLDDVLSVYEEFLGVSFERLNKPVLLFLDEIHADSKWAITIKSVYDRTKNVCIFATGSSALLLNTNADIERRAVFIKLYPLSFTEYMKIKHGQYETKGLANDIREALFESANSVEVYNRLTKLKQKINQYWMKIDRHEIDSYIKYGSLPFMIALNNEPIIYEQISRTLDKIIMDDVAYFGRFNSENLSKIPAILYMLAEADQVVLSKMADTIRITRPTLMEILSVLERTETINRIYPYGGHYTQVRKPSKFLFSAPAFRAMYYHFIGNIKPLSYCIGKLYEDTVGMYLVRLFNGRINYSITYDSAEEGADYILNLQDRKIVIEVGSGEKDLRQVRNTALKVKSLYNFVISKESLSLSEENNTVKIPFEYFLLI